MFVSFCFMELCVYLMFLFFLFRLSLDRDCTKSKIISTKSSNTSNHRRARDTLLQWEKNPPHIFWYFWFNFLFRFNVFCAQLWCFWLPKAFLLMPFYAIDDFLFFTLAFGRTDAWNLRSVSCPCMAGLHRLWPTSLARSLINHHYVTAHQPELSHYLLFFHHTGHLVNCIQLFNSCQLMFGSIVCTRLAIVNVCSASELIRSY